MGVLCYYRMVIVQFASPGRCCRRTGMVTYLEICTIVALKFCVKLSQFAYIFNSLEWNLLMCD